MEAHKTTAVTGKIIVDFYDEINEITEAMSNWILGIFGAKWSMEADVFTNGGEKENWINIW